MTNTTLTHHLAKRAKRDNPFGDILFKGAMPLQDRVFRIQKVNDLKQYVYTLIEAYASYCEWNNQQYLALEPRIELSRIEAKTNSSNGIRAGQLVTNFDDCTIKATITPQRHKYLEVSSMSDEAVTRLVRERDILEETCIYRRGKIVGIDHLTRYQLECLAEALLAVLTNSITINNATLKYY